MHQAVNARADADRAAMSIQRIYDSCARKQNAQRTEREHRAQRPDRDLATLMQQLLYWVGPQRAGERRKDEKPNADADHCGEYKQSVSDGVDPEFHRCLKVFS
jgi:hypothetical protein